jgi:phospholipid-binding lipoprotein MlaA
VTPNFSNTNIKAITLAVALTLGGCASQVSDEQANSSAELNSANPDDAAAENGVYDPLEPVNRVVWDFNYEIKTPYPRLYSHNTTICAHGFVKRI